MAQKLSETSYVAGRHVVGRRAALPVRPLYEAPRLIRVRVATTLLNAGKVTGDQNCTIHWHSDQNTCAE